MLIENTLIVDEPPDGVSSPPTAERLCARPRWGSGLAGRR